MAFPKKWWRSFPPGYFTLALIAMAILHRFAPYREILTAPATYIGAIPIVVGVAFAIWGNRAFARVETTIKPLEESSSLVTHGLYRKTRNPMYLGMVMVLIGTAVAMGSASPVVLVPLFVALIQTRFIRVEERMLEERFGDDYRAFTQRVRRWI